ncbi:AAA family ATPase [Anaerobacillus isosaccharinicus]|uniref:AAA family ATPase n=1 Tax=Anaerobacillus isosaccharinicus TaxID=1532552 RepID=A0A1S2LCT9_9BACI|nr:AAA family ATPase [Anaerobacillus isosaccharinicus]MBA5584913.1 AAA family ATPase [Anaerobacillus isosaccharinicus]QOY36729.1 AAA family ATPase [Anaerobacillus isosaccharinicus]
MVRTKLIDFLKESPISIDDFFLIALKLTRAVYYLHKQKKIIKVIGPHSIMIDNVTYELELLDDSFLVANESFSMSQLSDIHVVPYLSPELTGRNNSVEVDYRTNIYSVGVILYELLTKELPINASSTSEWVHQKKAQKIIPPHELNIEIPIVLSNIVMKCLERNLEERYQTVAGMKNDLIKCQKKWLNEKQIDDFPLGQADISPRLIFSKKLYGREQEYRKLMEQWQRVSVDNKNGVVFITGSAGVGKTRLVQEVKKQVKKNLGHFVSGKFDQVKNEIPYATFFQAFEQLIISVLTKEESEIKVWRDELLPAIGENAAVLTALIPKIKLIIGESIDLKETPPVELESRFKGVISSFLAVAARLSNPLVIFLDDLHWADQASLSLMKHIIAEKIEKLLIIGAYRDLNVSTDKHFVVNTFLDNGHKVTTITLSPLTIANIQDLLFDLIGHEKNELYYLAKHLWQKTNGNPFFLEEMIREIVEKQLIIYDFKDGTWTLEVEEIKALEFTENVIEFLIKKMKQMEGQSQLVIQYAACMGSFFDPTILSKIIRNKISDMHFCLNEISQLGLIVEENEYCYRFVHDRIQQAAYSMMNKEKKNITHYKIGKLLLIHYTDNQCLSEHLYEVVGHLNESFEFLIDEEEKVEIAKLNMMAGKKALATTAFISALTFFQNGLRLLEEESWSRQYDLTFELYLGCLECAYLTNKLSLAEELYDEAMVHTIEKEHRLKLVLLKIMIFTKVDRADDVIRLGLEMLNENGITAQLHPGKLQILLERIKLTSYLDKHGYDCLLQKPVYHNKSRELLNDILLFMGPSLHVINPPLLALLTIKGSYFSLKNGNSSNASGVFAGYAIIEVAYFSRKKGFEIGNFATKLAEEEGSIKDKYITYFLFAAFISHWKQPIKASEEYFLKSIEYSFLSGDLLYGGFSIAHYIISFHVRGFPLSKLKKVIKKYDEQKNEIKDTHYLQFIKTYKQYILALEGKTDTIFSFSDGNFNEEQFLTELEEAGMRDRKLFDYYLCKAQIYYLLGNYREGVLFAKEAEKYTGSFLGLISLPEHTFYYSLLITNALPHFTKEEKRFYTKQLKGNLKKYKGWVKDCPSNFEDKYFIIKGEIAKVNNQVDKAIRYYNQAAECAKANEFLQNEAISNECVARLYFQLELPEAGKMYLLSAYEKYNEMGYQTKITQLKKEYKFLQNQQLKYTDEGNIQINQLLDTSAIIKASQVISGEIVLEELLKKIMSIVLEYACANRCVLILKKEETLVVEAEGRLVGHEIKTLLYHSCPIDRYVTISQAVVNYVHRTQEPVLFDKEADQLDFLRDPYILEAKPKALLCIPIITQHKFIGIVYLENYVLDGSFSADYIEVIQTLSTQFAISIENANLYKTSQILNANLEEKVKERTKHLQNSHLAMAEALAEKAKLAERNRIAREIHDTVGHTLTTILVQIEAGKRLAKKDVHLAIQNLEQSQHQVRAGLNEIRTSLRTLSDGDYSNQLIPSLRTFIKEVNHKTQIEIEHDFSDITLPPDQKYVIYRAIQEGITNGIRHGEATKFNCFLKTSEDGLTFIFEDNGKGAENVKFGMGLSAMKERVEELRGSLFIQSKKGTGFCIKIVFPYEVLGNDN